MGRASAQDYPRALLMDVLTIEWNNVPQTHTRCTCAPSGEAQCAGDKRLVAIKDVPVSSRLAALVKLPQDGTFGPGICALYMDMNRDHTLVLPVNSS